MNDDQVLQLLRTAARDNAATQSVVIRADKRCVWEHVVNAMNLCNKAGIVDYRVNVLPEGG